MAFPPTRFISVIGVAAQQVLNVTRTFQTAEHAQLANPDGTVYFVEDAGDGDGEGWEKVRVVAPCGQYPLTLQETKVPGIGCNAEGAVVLRDLGPGKAHRWATHFRNDQLGGCHNGNYFDNYAEAIWAYAVASSDELKRIHDRREVTA